MVTILGVILTFILTVVIGNKITQSRQQDSWVAQQRFSGQEKEYIDLKTLSNQIASSTNIRIYATRRLARQYGSSSKSSLEGALNDYKEAVKSWNENISSYYVRLSQLSLRKFKYRLEKELHDPLVRQSSALENSAQRRIKPILEALDKINASALHFNEDLLIYVNEVRDEIYFPKRIIFSLAPMQKFSTWQLIKALFTTDINSISILRSPLDP